VAPTQTAPDARPTTEPDRWADPEVDVSVVVVGFRTPELVRRCVRSVLEQTRDVTLEVLVVDNDASPGAVADPALLDAGCTVILPDGNLGFARAVNRAAEVATGRYVLLLNPDTVVVDGAIDRLVAFADEHPGHGLYGGRTVDADGHLDPRSCWGFPTLWSTFCFATGLASAAKGHAVLDPESLGRWARDSVREVDVVTGCLCLVRTSTWRGLGGFDERFFVYGEDVDLALRARDAGFRPLLCPEATVVHDVGASSTRAEKLVLLHRGKVSLLRKHWSRSRAAVGVALLRSGVALRARVADDPSWRELHERRGEWTAGHPVAR
jgi:GT2 family glycosyltransferase